MNWYKRTKTLYLAAILKMHVCELESMKRVRKKGPAQPLAFTYLTFDFFMIISRFSFFYNNELIQ